VKTPFFLCAILFFVLVDHSSWFASASRAAESGLDGREAGEGRVRVEIFEGIPNKASWDFTLADSADCYETSAFAFVEIPNKYTPRGVRADRSDPFLIRATGQVTVPEGKWRVLVRCRNAARLYLDGVQIAETPFHSISASGHDKVRELDASLAPRIRPLQRGDSHRVCEIVGDGQPHAFRLEMIVGGRDRRPEFGETSVSIGPPDGDFQLLSPAIQIPLTDAGWLRFAADQRRELAEMNAQRRREASVAESQYWDRRHELARQQLSELPSLPPPAYQGPLPVQNEIDRYLNARLEAAGEQPTPLAGDWEFLRRVTLDVIGTIPTPEQVEQFFGDTAPDRRSRWIDRLLAADGWADHWVGYWQDVLAENPNIVNPTLNNTGPFRWWIHESFLDNKPFDRFATELVLMEGSQYFGGPAGFALATENDVPMAAKAHIVGQAFLALEMKCARCHDAPYHDFKQRDLFSLAAMLKRDVQEVPKTSSIPGGDDAVKSLLIEVTLKPGEKVAPQWSFAPLVPDAVPDGILRDAADTRERAAALLTSARNQRFARVIVNRLWKRYLGRGLVEPVDDWETAKPSDPELLDYLARQLVHSGYDLKYVARLILNSHAYQRSPRGEEVLQAGQPYLFAGPIRRRVSAEQLVDSLFLAAGKSFDAGPMCIDVDGARPAKLSLNLGEPTRAWQFSSVSNERDRPSLALPFTQPFVTLMETFGWRSSRQDPRTVRNDEPTALQPAIMANGSLTGRIVRLSDDSAFTALALQDQPLDALIRQLFLRLLTREPTATERQPFVVLLEPGYDQRRAAQAAPEASRPRLRRGVVSWSNHLDPEASVVQAELEAAVLRGDPPTPRLQADWRERLEDMIWTLVNSPEVVFVP
jgi:hypothetical protein